MNVRGLITRGALTGALLSAMSGPLAAQHPVEGTEWMMFNLRAKGQPVIPIFDGWYQKPDGTHDLCFGYFNLNTEQSLDLPLGPDNFITPARFDGAQPTHFMPVPPPPNTYRRYFCVFTVNLPADYGREDEVVWTLRVNGQDFSVPGYLKSINYRLDEIAKPATGQGGRGVAPQIRFAPSGPEGVGRSGVWALPMTVAVGRPLTLSMDVTFPDSAFVAGIRARSGITAASGDGGANIDDDGDVRPVRRPGERPRDWWVIWTEHQGPGGVAFEPQELDVLQGETAVTTTATFSAPGRYVLRVQAIDNPGEGGSYQFHCCWTNGYVEVTVTP
jgi:hypothetical protein